MKLWHFEYEGTHYYAEAAKDNYSAATLEGRYRGDGVDFQQSVGDRSWYFLPHRMVELTKLAPEKKTRIGYHLKDAYPESELTPRDIPDPDYFKPDCGDFDYSRREIKSLYEPVYSVEPEYWEAVEFEVVEAMTGGHPRQPKYAQTTWNLEHRVALATRHHKPCWISGDAMYQIIREAVKANLPKHCHMAFDNNSWFTVEAAHGLPVAESEVYTETVGRGRSKRNVTAVLPIRTMSRIVLQMHTPSKDYNYGPPAPIIKGDNLDELEANVQAEIDKHIAVLNDTKITICPKCNGYGYHKMGKGVEVGNE